MRLAIFLEDDDGGITSIMIPPEVMGPVTVTLAQAVTAFSAFLPDMKDIRRMNYGSDPEFAADVRCGEFNASILVIGTGLLLSALLKSKWPALVAVFTSLFLTAMYEYILTGRPFSNA